MVKKGKGPVDLAKLQAIANLISGESAPVDGSPAGGASIAQNNTAEPSSSSSKSKPVSKGKSSSKGSRSSAAGLLPSSLGNDRASAGLGSSGLGGSTLDDGYRRSLAEDFADDGDVRGEVGNSSTHNGSNQDGSRLSSGTKGSPTKTPWARVKLYPPATSNNSSSGRSSSTTPQVLMAAVDMRAHGLRSGQSVVLLAAFSAPAGRNASSQSLPAQVHPPTFAIAPSLDEYRVTEGSRTPGTPVGGGKVAIGVATLWPSADCKAGSAFLTGSTAAPLYEALSAATQAAAQGSHREVEPLSLSVAPEGLSPQSPHMQSPSSVPSPAISPSIAGGPSGNSSRFVFTRPPTTPPSSSFNRDGGVSRSGGSGSNSSSKQHSSGGGGSTALNILVSSVERAAMAATHLEATFMEAPSNQGSVPAAPFGASEAPGPQLVLPPSPSVAKVNDTNPSCRAFLASTPVPWAVHVRNATAVVLTPLKKSSRLLPRDNYGNVVDEVNEEEAAPWLGADVGSPLLLRNALRGAVVVASSSSARINNFNNTSGVELYGCVWLVVCGRKAPYMATFRDKSNSCKLRRTVVIYHVTASTIVDVTNRLPLYFAPEAEDKPMVAPPTVKSEGAFVDDRNRGDAAHTSQSSGTTGPHELSNDDNRVSYGTDLLQHGSSIAKHRDGSNDERRRNSGWGQVGGLGNQIAVLREAIELPLRNPEVFTKFGLRPPRGVLLYGPPGTGKTTLAKAAAVACGASLVILNGAEVTSRYAGESEATLRRAFRAASNGDRSFSVGGSASGHSTAPADSNIGGSSASDSSSSSSSGGGGRILFIDEIDALAPATASNASEVDRRLVATLLALLDGIGGDQSDNNNSNINRGNEDDNGGSSSSGSNKSSSAQTSRTPRFMVIAATNRPFALEPALRRPGRLDREIEVGVPDEAGRRDILRVLLRQLPCPYRRTSDRKEQHQQLKTPLDTKAVVDDAMKSFEKLTIDSETVRSGQDSATGSTEESAAEESAEVDDATLALLAANSHGFVGADLQLVCSEAILAAVRRHFGTVSIPRSTDSSSSTDSCRSSGGSSSNSSSGGSTSNSSGNNDSDSTATTAGTTNSLVVKDAEEGKTRATAAADAAAAATPTSGLVVTGSDLMEGLRRVRPSALREVSIEVPSVKWSDIGGQEDAKKSLQEVVEWPLQYPAIFARLGVKAPAGVLLYGPPGCSKTLIAKALATESKMNFLAVQGPELLSKWLGESERALATVFKRARAAAPAIVFFDEIDAIAARRGGESDSLTSERLLTQLLVEMDGATSGIKTRGSCSSSSSGHENSSSTSSRTAAAGEAAAAVQAASRVVVVAATNRPDMLDDALLRPGRLDRHVYIAPPNAAARAQILSIALRKTPHTLETALLLAMPPTACTPPPPPSSRLPSPSPSPFVFTPYGATAQKNSSSATSALKKEPPPAYTPFGDERPNATTSPQTLPLKNTVLSDYDVFTSGIACGGGAASKSFRGQEQQHENQMLQPPLGKTRLNAHLRCLAALTDGCSGAEMVAIVRDAALKAIEERQAILTQRTSTAPRAQVGGLKPSSIETSGAVAGVSAASAPAQEAKPTRKEMPLLASTTAASKAITANAGTKQPTAEMLIPGLPAISMDSLPPVVVTPLHLLAAATAAAAQKRITPAMLRFYETYRNNNGEVDQLRCSHVEKFHRDELQPVYANVF